MAEAAATMKEAMAMKACDQAVLLTDTEDEEEAKESRDVWMRLLAVERGKACGDAGWMDYSCGAKTGWMDLAGWMD